MNDKRINSAIRSNKVMVINNNGQQLGILPKHIAISKAQNQGYDLVEVSAKSNPPVCRIMDYGKYKFEQNKLDIAKVIDVQAMKDAGLISGTRNGVRLLGMGKLSSKLDIEVAGASKSAVLAVEKAGGKVILPKPTKALLGAREQSAKQQAKKAIVKDKNVNTSSNANIENDSKDVSG